MLKLALFLSLYTTAGVGSWHAYNYISQEDTSLQSLSSLIADQLNEQQKTPSPKKASHIIYRWQDYQGNWTYEDAPYSELSFKNYEDELKFLNVLKENREKFNQSAERNFSIETPAPLAASPSSLNSQLNQLTKLFSDAKSIQQLVDTRQEKLNEASGFLQ